MILMMRLVVFLLCFAGVLAGPAAAQDGADSSIITRQVMVERLMEERIQAALKTILGPIDATVLVRTEWTPKPKTGGGDDSSKNVSRRGLALPGVPINPELTKRATDASVSLAREYDRKVTATIFLPYEMNSSKMEMVTKVASTILDLDPAAGDSIRIESLGRKPVELKKAFWDTMNWEAVMRGLTLLLWILVIAFLFGPLSRYLKVAPQMTDMDRKGGGGPSPLESALAPMAGGGGAGGEASLSGGSGAITVTQGSGELFTFINKENLKALSGVLVKEPPQVTGIVLQVLPRKVASQLLMQLPLKMQVSLLLQFKRVKYGNPEYVKELDRKLRSQMGFQMGGLDQARRIMQSVPSAPRANLLQMMAAVDGEYTQTLGNSIFEMKDLLLYDSKSIARIFRDAGVVAFARVLKMSQPAFRKEILSKLHPSVARLLDEQIHMMQEVDSTLMEDEMLRIADTVERLSSDGTIPPVLDVKLSKAGKTDAKAAPGGKPAAAAAGKAPATGGVPPGKAPGGKAKVAGLALALLLGGFSNAFAFSPMLTATTNTFTSGAEGDSVVQYGYYTYVAGKTESPSGFFIQKINEFLVTTNYITSTEAQSDGEFYTVGLTADDDGNLYLCSVTGTNVAVFKYNSSLVFLASATYTGAGDVANVIKMDPAGDLIITGGSNSNSGLLMLKIDTDLNLLASKRIEDGVTGMGTGLAFDSDANIFVSNWYMGGTEYRVLKLDASFNVLDSNVYSETGITGFQQAAAVLVGPDETVYLTGRMGNSVSAKSVTVRFDNGLNAWISSAAVTSDGFTMGRELEYDSTDGTVVVGGVGTVISTFNYTVRKYSLDLTQLVSSSSFSTGVTNYKNGAYGMGFDYNKNLIVTGRSADNALSVMYFGPPIIKSVSEGWQGALNAVDITGKNFAPGVAVGITSATFGTITYFDCTHISLNVTLADAKPLGYADVAVTNPDGKTATLTNGMPVVRQMANLSYASTQTIDAGTIYGTMTVVFPPNTFGANFGLRMVMPNSMPTMTYGYTYVAGPLNITFTETPISSYTLTLPYRTVDAGKFQPNKFAISYYSTVYSTWTNYASVVNTASHTVTSLVKTPGLYAIMTPAGTGGGGGGGGPDTSRLDVYIYPNPYKPGSGGDYDNPEDVTGMIVANLKPLESMQFQVLDAAGEEVYYNTGDADSDGNWVFKAQSTGGVPLASGVYFYIVRIGGTEVKKGKFAIIRAGAAKTTGG